MGPIQLLGAEEDDHMGLLRLSLFKSPQASASLFAEFLSRLAFSRKFYLSMNPRGDLCISLTHQNQTAANPLTSILLPLVS